MGQVRMTFLHMACTRDWLGLDILGFRFCFPSLNIGALLREPNIFFWPPDGGIFKVNKQKSQVKVSWDRALNQSMKKGGKFKLGKRNLNPRISNPNQSLVVWSKNSLTVLLSVITNMGILQLWSSINCAHVDSVHHYKQRSTRNWRETCLIQFMM